MAVRIPLVVANGQIEQLQSSDTLGLLAISYHVISTDTTIPDGAAAAVSRYVEISAGVTLTLGDDGDLEIL